MSSSLANVRAVWDRISRLDLAALFITVTGIVGYFLQANSRLLNYLEFIAVLAAIYLFYRLLAWGRSRLLWSLRNRLIVAYLFIAVVPILLLVLLAVRSAGVLYSQLAAYLLYEDVQRRKDMLSDIAEHIAAAHAALPRGATEEESERILAAQSHVVHDREIPGLEIHFSDDVNFLEKIAGNRTAFAGLLQQGDDPKGLSITIIRAMHEIGRASCRERV